MGLLCLIGAVQVNDTIIADPQFTLSLPVDGTKALCYELHGSTGKYFNLISDSCLSVNAYFSPMDDQTRGNRISKIGVHAVAKDNFAALGSDALGGCVDIQINLEGCSALVNHKAVDSIATVGDVHLKKIKNKWRVSVPNCERASVVMWVVCVDDKLHLDVVRGSNLKPTSHGLLGESPDTNKINHTNDMSSILLFFYQFLCRTTMERSNLSYYR